MDYVINEGGKPCAHVFFHIHTWGFVKFVPAPRRFSVARDHLVSVFSTVNVSELYLRFHFPRFFPRKCANSNSANTCKNSELKGFRRFRIVTGLFICGHRKSVV